MAFSKPISTAARGYAAAAAAAGGGPGALKDPAAMAAGKTLLAEAQNWHAKNPDRAKAMKGMSDSAQLELHTAAHAYGAAPGDRAAVIALLESATAYDAAVRAARKGRGAQVAAESGAAAVAAKPAAAMDAQPLCIDCRKHTALKKQKRCRPCEKRMRAAIDALPRCRDCGNQAKAGLDYCGLHAPAAVNP